MVMRARILVIEDELAISDLICMNLEAAGYESAAFYNGNEAADVLERDASYDLALLDVMLPGRDGFSLLPFLREKQIPEIFLTAKGDVASKVKGLKSGAEDYIVKPFEMLELLVRIEKILERSGKRKEECIRIRDVCIYPGRRLVTRGGTEVALKPMEFDCLLMFVRYKNIALTREQLLAGLWGVEFDGETRTVDVHVGRIRKKLDFWGFFRRSRRIGCGTPWTSIRSYGRENARSETARAMRLIPNGSGRRSRSILRSCRLQTAPLIL